jgi:aspartyl-tRNA synthetase
MSFAGEEDVMTEIEKLLRNLWYRVLKKQMLPTFPRMTYQEAMASYGSDKPDLRYQAKVYVPSLNPPTSLTTERSTT